MVLNESIKVKLTMEINNVADISSVIPSSDAHIYRYTTSCSFIRFFGEKIYKSKDTGNCTKGENETNAKHELCCYMHTFTYLIILEVVRLFIQDTKIVPVGFDQGGRESARRKPSRSG